jgi:hypothetical protein
MMLASLTARARRVFGVSNSVAVARPAELARPLFPTWLHLAVPIAIVAAWAAAIAHVPLREMTDAGLISVLPRTVILLLFLLTLSFCLSLARRPINGLVPLLHVVVLIVMLYGITAFLEQEPRFAVGWSLVGIIHYIGQHGTVNPRIDAFFDWPAFFALGALITKAAGFHNALAFSAWGPLTFNLLFLAPLVVIFRWASDDKRVTWLGLWVFYSTNWVAQDYIAPQAMGFTLWLSILAALLTWFTPRPRALVGGLALRRLSRLLHVQYWRSRLTIRRQDVEVPGFAYQRVGVLLLILVIYGAIVTGHQLTPVSALLTVICLTLFARLETQRLPLIMAVLLVAWISYMTTAFLTGNLNLLIGPIGHVSQNLNQSVSARVSGSHEHQVIVNIREYATVGIWGLAVAGFGRRLRAGRIDIAIAVIAGAPFLEPLVQPYGGEILLRVFLFSLPAVSFFIATLAFPSERTAQTWLTTAGVTVIGCLLLAVFQYTRYGNERLDYFTKGDFTTVQQFYRLAPNGSTVYAGDGNIPWQYEDYAGYNYDVIGDLPAWKARQPDPATLAAQLQAALAKSGGYVIVTRSTEIEAELLEGKPHVLDTLVALLRASPAFRELYRTEDGVLFYAPPARTQPHQSPRSTHTRTSAALSAARQSRSGRSGHRPLRTSSRSRRREG